MKLEPVEKTAEPSFIIIILFNEIFQEATSASASTFGSSSNLHPHWLMCSFPLISTTDLF